MKKAIDGACLALMVIVVIGVASLSACGGLSEMNTSEHGPASNALSSTGTPAWEVKTLVSNDIERTYRVLAPLVDGQPKLPMLIVMHGWSFSAQQTIEVGGWDGFAVASHFILVLPEGVGLSWNSFGSCCPPASTLGIDDVQFIADLIDDVAGQYRLDRARVYASGISNGASMAYRLACERPDLIAAVGSVTGTLGEETCAPGRPVPVIEIHGTADLLNPYHGGVGPIFGNVTLGAPGTVAVWAANNSCSSNKKTTFAGADVTCEQYRACKADAKVELCTINGGGHNWPGSATDLYKLDPVTFRWWGYQTNEIAAHEVIWNFVKQYRVNP